MLINQIKNHCKFRAKAIIFALFVCLIAGQIVVCAEVQGISQDETAVAETAAFKGIAFLGKTESGMRLLQQIGGATQKAKAAIGALEIPVKAAEIVLTDGSKIKMPFGETKRLDELLAPLESRAKQVLSSGANKVKSISLPAWNKLEIKLDHILSGHKTEGSRLLQSIKDGGQKDVFPSWMTDKQILKAVEEAYNSSKKLGTQIDGKGNNIIELIGEAKDGLKIKMYINTTQKTLDTAFTQ